MYLRLVKGDCVLELTNGLVSGRTTETEDKSTGAIGDGPMLRRGEGGDINEMLKWKPGPRFANIVSDCDAFRFF